MVTGHCYQMPTDHHDYGGADLWCGDDEKHDVPWHLSCNCVPARPCVGLLS